MRWLPASRPSHRTDCSIRSCSAGTCRPGGRRIHGSHRSPWEPRPRPSRQGPVRGPAHGLFPALVRPAAGRAVVRQRRRAQQGVPVLRHRGPRRLQQRIRLEKHHGPRTPQRLDDLHRPGHVPAGGVPAGRVRPVVTVRHRVRHQHRCLPDGLRLFDVRGHRGAHTARGGAGVRQPARRTTLSCLRQQPGVTQAPLRERLARGDAGRGVGGDERRCGSQVAHARDDRLRYWEARSELPARVLLRGAVPVRKWHAAVPMQEAGGLARWALHGRRRPRRALRRGGGRSAAA